MSYARVRIRAGGAEELSALSVLRKASWSPVAQRDFSLPGYARSWSSRAPLSGPMIDLILRVSHASVLMRLSCLKKPSIITTGVNVLALQGKFFSHLAFLTVFFLGMTLMVLGSAEGKHKVEAGV